MAPKADQPADATPAPQQTSAVTGAVPPGTPIVAQDDETPPSAPPTPVADADQATPSPTGAASVGPSPAEVQSANAMVNPQVDPQRAAVTAALLRQTALGVPQPNPTLPGAAGPPLGPTSPETGGRVVSDITKAPDIVLRPGMQLAQAGTKPAPLPPRLPPESQMPPAVPRPGAPPQPFEQPPSVGRVPIDPSAATMPQFPLAPAMPPMTQRHIDALRGLQSGERNPAVLAIYQQALKEEEQARADKYAPILKDWEMRKDIYERDYEAERSRVRNLPQTTLELQKAELAQQQALQDAKLRQRLGDIPQEVYIQNLNKSKENIATLPSTMDSIKRARDLLPKMYTGPLADTDTFLAKLMGSAGFPLDPRASGTEQFKTAMAAVMAQNRKAIVGPGSQSEAELALLQKSSAADAKLTPDTIRATLDAAERLSLQTALAHQKLVRRFAGDDPDRQGMVYGAYGVPNMVDLVPQAAVDRLRKNSTDPRAHAEFDDAFQTPGLSRDVLRYRR